MISLRSSITIKLLNYFYLNPHDSLYVNEISRILRVDKRNLVKKIKELKNEGIIKSTNRGNLKFYSINKDYPLYEEYRKITLKTVGIEERLKNILKETKDVKIAYIYGSYAKDELQVYSDIDLLVIGNHDIVFLQSKLNKLQKEINREINVVNMDEDEFKQRKRKRDSYITDVLRQKNIRIL